jgi:hypothetical protein
MTPSRALPALALALVLLPACGGGDDKPAAAKTTGPPAVEPREYARALADPAESLRESYTDWDQGCSTGNALTCGVGAVTLSASAETLAIRLELATREGQADYVGRLAAEDQPLLDDTIADAEAMKLAARKLMDSTCNMVVNPTGECIELGSAVDEAWRKLDFDLAGWAKHA